MLNISFSGHLNSRLVLMAVLTLITCGSIALFAEDDDKGKNSLLVDDDKVQCPTAQYTEIQQAVAAAPSGATIHVCPGTYKIQVKITKPLKIVADTGSILQPVGAVPNAFSLNDNTAITALLLVTNTKGVSIDDLTVDGAKSAPTGCGPDYVGVMYQNAAGALTNMAVRNIKLGTGQEGCQSGEGIFVQNGSGNLEVDISDSSVHDYQKTGILIDRNGSNATVKHNYVTGLGSTPNIAQNGIQISRGASAVVTNNFVNNHIYSPCTAIACTAVSTNIVVIDSPDVSVRNNTAGTAQVGIYVSSNNVQVQNNDVYDNKIFDGIDLVGNNNHASNNNVYHSDASGIFVDGNNNHIDGNTINEAPIGVLINSGSGNQVNGNQYFNVPVPTSGSPTHVAAPVNATGRPPASTR